MYVMSLDDYIAMFLVIVGIMVIIGIPLGFFCLKVCEWIYSIQKQVQQRKGE
jgi:hypothetical protein